MNQKLTALFIAGLLALVLNTTRTDAQTVATLPRAEVPGTQVLKLTSTVVAGQEYVLYINFPVHYDRDTAESYPVIFLLDGQYDFPLFAGIYSDQYYDGFLPRAITVGITWGGKDPDVGSLRALDYTPTHIAQMDNSGRGPKFHEFIKKELIPFIKSKYRVTDDRTLVGSSYGGLFTLYALFSDPTLFRRYILTSPAIGWDNNVLRTWETKYEETGTSGPVRLFMGIGALEGTEDFQKFADSLQDKKVKGLELHTLILENTGHGGTKPEGFSRGLQWAFERPSLTFPSSVLDKYAGSYQLGKDTVNFSPDNGKLTVIGSGSNKTVLLAETEKDFYLNGQFLRLHFKADNTGKVSGFELEQFDGKVFFRKIK